MTGLSCEVIDGHLTPTWTRASRGYGENKMTILGRQQRASEANDTFTSGPVLHLP